MGSGGFEQQTFDYDATVVKRLDAAGAVLVAKLTMGALAQGRSWFGGRTRNPWNTKQGSERVVGGLGCGAWRRDAWGLRSGRRRWDRSRRLQHAMRSDGVAADLRVCSPHGGDGADAGRWIRLGRSAGAWRTAPW